MPLGGGRLQPDARGQGGLCREPRLPPRDWIFSRLEMWARLASRLPIAPNFLLSPAVRGGIIERLLGVSRHRVLPRVRRTPFTRRAARLGLHRAPGPSNPAPGWSTSWTCTRTTTTTSLPSRSSRVLRQAEVNVYVPTRQRSSGMAPLIVGDVDYARELALANLRVLGNAVRDGYTVVCSEPTAALMLRQEYVRLTDDLDAELVARNTMDLGQYLHGPARARPVAAPGGAAPTPASATISRATSAPRRRPAGPRPAPRASPNWTSSSSIAAARAWAARTGWRTTSSARSLRAGRELLEALKDDDIEIGSTECGACRIQMEQGSDQAHAPPRQAPYAGYGLTRSLRQHFNEPNRHATSCSDPPAIPFAAGKPAPVTRAANPP